MPTKDERLADLNALCPADRNATAWAATPDGSWSRRVGAGVNPDFPVPIKPPPPAKKGAPAVAVRPEEVVVTRQEVSDPRQT